MHALGRPFAMSMLHFEACFAARMIDRLFSIDRDHDVIATTMRRSGWHLLGGNPLLQKRGELATTQLYFPPHILNCLLTTASHSSDTYHPG